MTYLFQGKASVFGGEGDKTNPNKDANEGTALYEHAQADMRPDLFSWRIRGRGVFARLKPDALYIAVRFAADSYRPKSWWRRAIARITTRDQGKRPVDAAVVDWGPAEWTGRAIDVSPRVAELLSIKTDDWAQVEILAPQPEQWSSLQPSTQTTP